MREKCYRWVAGMAILAGGVWLTPNRLCAQAGEGERGQIEIGIRRLWGDRSSSQFNAYRDIPQGLFIRYSEVNLNNLLHNSFFVNLQSRDTRERDQTYLLGLGAYRKYRIDVRGDQTPHVFTNTARSFLVESSPGVFTVPAPIRSTLRSQPSSLRALLDGAPLLDMSLRREMGSGAFTYTPTSDWAFQFQYSREKQTGRRPFGTTTNQFTNTVELPEPIDYRTHQVKAGAEYAKKRWGFQASYSGSVFDNAVSTLVWDVPFLTADAQGGSSRGRLDLYPNNTAHSLSFAGAINLPHSTRFMASISPGWMQQNDAFLPFTINSAINTGPPFVNPCPGTAITDVGCLPAQSLHGKKGTLAQSYELTSKAIPALPLTLRYRSYDYNNDTPSLIFSDWVKSDTQLVGTARRSMPFAYDRKTLGLDASWEFVKNSSLSFLYEWERMNREHREVERSDERTAGAAFNLNPRKWVAFKASYRHSERKPEEYEVDEATWPYGEGPETNPTGGILAFGGPGPGLGQIEGLRKFDEAARGRHRAEALIQITPGDKFAVTASYGTTQDDYHQSEYGLMKDINYNYSLELAYNPHPAATFFAEYTREKYKYRQRSRQRSPGNPTTAANDSPNNDWESNRRDLVDTMAVGVDASPYRKVSVDVFYTFSMAKNRIQTRALGDRLLPRFLPTTAVDYPDTSNRWHEVVASVKFPLKGSLTPKFEYRYEKYDRMDFQMVNVGQYFILDPSTAAGVFLRADVPGYHAHILAVSLAYQF